ncbi:MAG: hypothetical protein CME06_12425 [Gemmatimonadetes bacterium]|nr:hypothetical protein [Gemmatimonadota bacterium]
MRTAHGSEFCTNCGETLGERRGIEVGHIFKLGTKYSSEMGATYLDENGKSQPLVMGCYGIGISRIAAAAVEQQHDDWGCIWPVPIAPFEVAVIPADAKKENVTNAAEKLYAELNEAGIEVVIDDRKMKPGPKFKDADLIGFPYKIIVGRGIERDGTVEIKARADGTIQELPVAEAIDWIVSRVVAERLSDLPGT